MSNSKSCLKWALSAKFVSELIKFHSSLIVDMLCQHVDVNELFAFTEGFRSIAIILIHPHSFQEDKVYCAKQVF